MRRPAFTNPSAPRARSTYKRNFGPRDFDASAAEEEEKLDLRLVRELHFRTLNPPPPSVKGRVDRLVYQNPLVGALS